MKKFYILKWVFISFILSLNFYVAGSNPATEKVVFSESFDGFTLSGPAEDGGATDVDIAQDLDRYTTETGWSGNEVFQAGGAIKMGTENVLGWIQTPPLFLTSDDGKFNVKFRAMAWNNDSVSLVIKVINGNDTATYRQSGLNNTDYQYSNYTLELNGGTDHTIIRIEGQQSSYGRFFLDNLEITQMLDNSTVANPSISPGTGFYNQPQLVTLSTTTSSAPLFYTLDGTTPNPGSNRYTVPFTVAPGTTVKTRAYRTDYSKSGISTAVYTQFFEVPDIATFKAINGQTNPMIFKIAGDLAFVFRSGRYIYLQDETGGLLVFDGEQPVITNTYQEGQIITGGIFGTYADDSGLSRFIPVSDMPRSTSPGGVIESQNVYLDEIISGYDQYESRLVTLTNVVMEGGVFSADSSTGVRFTQYGTDTMICVNTFGTLNMNISENGIYKITGFVSKVDGSYYISPRNNGDISIYVPSPVGSPVFSPEPGMYYNAQTVTLEPQSPRSEIYYTVDGNDPDSSSLLYTVPFVLDTNTTIKAIAYETGYPHSDIAEAVYTFPVPVSDIAGFKAARNTVDTAYTITGNVWITYVDAPHLFVEDSTGGLWIYDPEGFMENTVTAWQVGDIIHDLAGNSELYEGQMNRLHLKATLPEAVDNLGDIQPVPVTVEGLKANFALYESRIIALENMNFETPGTIIGNLPVDIRQDTARMQLYDQFGNLDGYTAPEGLFAMKGIAAGSFGEILLLPGNSNDIIPNPVSAPYEEDFENPLGNLNWRLLNDGMANKWYIGTTQGFDNHKLFISDYNGVSNRYSVSSASIVHAYRDLTIPGEGAELRFDYRVMGEENDYLQVSLLSADDTLSGTEIPANYLVRLYGTNDWMNHSEQLLPGTYRLVFSWVNDNANGNQYPAAIDNITVLPLACGSPLAIHAESDTAANGVIARISWDVIGEQSEWILEYKLASREDWISLHIHTSPNAILTGLHSDADYDVRVKGVCDSLESAYSQTTFRSLCIHYNVEDEVHQIGDLNGQSAVLPFHGNYVYSYSQQIYSHEVIPGGKGLIDTIAFYCLNRPDPSKTGDIKIWMANVAKNNFESNKDYIDPSELTLVYEMVGEWDLTADSWNIIALDRPFYYDGTSNLVIAFYEGRSGFNGANFRTWQTSRESAICQYSDDANVVSFMDPASTTAISNTYSNNNTILIRKYWSECIDRPVCVTPHGLIADAIGFESAELQWNEDTTVMEWIVEYRAQEGNWNSVAVTEPRYSLHNLQQGTEYEVRVSALCGEYSYSEYSESITFVTSSRCAAPDHLSVTGISNSVILSWNANGATEWVTQLKKDTDPENTWITTYVEIAPSALYRNLEPRTLYNFRVKSLCGADEESPWVSFDFSTDCDPFTLPFYESFSENIRPACWKDLHNSWNFDRGSAQSSRSAEVNYLITPPIEIPSQPVSFSFDISGNGSTAGESYELRVAPTSATEDFISIYSGTIQGTPFETVEFEIPSQYTGQTLYFAWVHYPVSTGISVDNIEITACGKKPYDVRALYVLSDRVNLDWNTDGNETRWNIEYSEDGSQWNTVLADRYPFMLTGLEANTEYRIRVRAFCTESDFGNFSDELIINTTCSPVTVFPFTEGFENGMPDCWTQQKVRGTADWTVNNGGGSANPPSAHTGSGNAFYSATTRNTLNILITPQLDLSSYSEVILSFWHAQAVWGRDQDRLRVLYRSHPDSTWMVLANYTTDIPQWTEREFVLPELSSTYWIAFEGVSNYGYGIVLDDIYVGPREACLAPSVQGITAITDTSAVVTWNPGRDETSWQLDYKPETSENWTSLIIEDFPSHTLDALSPLTEYRVRVRAICDNAGYSEFSESGFTTVYPSVAPAVDLKLDTLFPIPVSCYMHDVSVTVGVRQIGTSSVNTFTLHYQVDDKGIITEHIQLPTPLNSGEVHTYTFQNLAAFTESHNTLKVWVENPEDPVESNNRLSTTVNKPELKEIPYSEDFSDVLFHQQEWLVTDANLDGITWENSQGTPTYTFSNTLAANDWLISPCIFIPEGRYEISYTYNALSVLTESFSVYLGTSSSIADMNLLIGSHPDVRNTPRNVVYRDTVTITQSHVYHVGVHATSLPGNVGLIFDNLAITPLIDIVVDFGNGGFVTPSGTITAEEGSSLALEIYPEYGYHLSGIYLNGRLIEGEDRLYSRFYTYVHGPATDGDSLYIEFTPNRYRVYSSVSNYLNTDYYGDGRIAGTISPEGETMVSYRDSVTFEINVDENFHLYHLWVNGTDDIGNAVQTAPGIYEYRLNEIVTDYTIEAVIKLDTILMTYVVQTGKGVVDGRETDATDSAVTYRFVVDHGSSHTLTLSPEAGYRIREVKINGISMGAITRYEFSTIISGQYVEIGFEKNLYVISTSAYGNGAISAGTTVAFDPEYRYGFEVAPNPGYFISSLLINNRAVVLSGNENYYTDTLAPITQDYDIRAYFTEKTYTVEAVAGDNGFVNPAGITSYRWGTSALYTAYAATGYYISSVTIDSLTDYFTAEDNRTEWSHTFTHMENDHFLGVTFAPHAFTIASAAGLNGTISPEGDSTVVYGSSVRYTISPDEGYEIDALIVDGISVAPSSQYTFVRVTENHTIEALFTRLQYTITATAAMGGTVTPDGIRTYDYGATQAYQASASSGYFITDVVVDGVPVEVNSTQWSYTFTRISGNHSLHVNFAQTQYNVEVIQPQHGTITPGSQIVRYGATPTYRITPASGYEIEHITVNGSQVPFNTDILGAAVYTFPAVTSGQTLTATMKIKTYTVTASAGPDGSVTPAGSVTVDYGSSQTYTITPSPGYEIENVVIDGRTSVGARSTYTFSNIRSDHTLSATFRAISCETPYNLYTSALIHNAAVLHWQNTGAESYTVKFKIRGDANYIEIPGIHVNSHALGGLAPDTYYVWTVKAVCNLNESEEATEVTFKTAEDPYVGIGEMLFSDIQVYGYRDQVHIVNNSDQTAANVEIFDVYGKLIYKDHVNSSHEIITLPVATGTYVVRLQAGNAVGTYKVHLIH